MTIKNIFKIHSSFLFITISCIITGLFREFLIFCSIIIVHEFGHYICAKAMNLNVSKIVIYPFGGILYLNEQLDIPLSKEMFSLLGGIIFQSLFYLLIMLFSTINIINYHTMIIFTNYYYSILIFNLLPIYPLDGIKILNVFINKFFSFKLSHKATIWVSVVTLLMTLILINSQLMVSYYLILGIIIYNIYVEIRNHRYLINRFLLEKKIYPNKFKKHKLINSNNIEKMMRNKKHCFKDKQGYLTEKQKLEKYFNMFDKPYKK